MATKASKNGGSGMIESFGRDDSSMNVGSDKEATKGREMGGSVTNLKHSLSGSSAVQKVGGGD